MYTATQLKDRLEKMTADNDKKLEALRDEIKRIEGNHGNADYVKRQLADMFASARASEDIAQRNYDVQLQREQAQQKAVEKTQMARAAEMDAKNKARAEREYVRAGGDPAAFASAWETTLRAKMIEESVIQASKKPEPARSNIGITQGF